MEMEVDGSKNKVLRKPAALVLHKAFPCFKYETEHSDEVTFNVMI
jgi:hypothetical protein